MNKLFKKIDKASDVSRKEGSGRSKSVSTEKNIELVEEMILSQSQRIIDPKPANHSTTAMTAHELHFEKKDKKRYRNTTQQMDTFFDVPGNFVFFVVFFAIFTTNCMPRYWRSCPRGRRNL